MQSIWMAKCYFATNAVFIQISQPHVKLKTKLQKQEPGFYPTCGSAQRRHRPGPFWVRGTPGDSGCSDTNLSPCLVAAARIFSLCSWMWQGRPVFQSTRQTNRCLLHQKECCTNVKASARPQLPVMGCQGHPWLEPHRGLFSDALSVCESN